MSAPSNDVLANMIENLTQKVEEGFKVMHEKQDKTNGNVKCNTEFRITQLTHNKWMYGLFAIVIVPILFLIFKI